MSDQMSEGIDLDTAGERTVHGTLAIETVEVSPDRVVLRMPVTPRVHQPYGILHGGVSGVLAESAASFGAGVAAGPDRRVVGIELNLSHLRPVSSGSVTAVATPVRKGRSIQVWEITLSDDEGRETCRGRCTLAVTAPPPGQRAGSA